MKMLTNVAMLLGVLMAVVVGFLPAVLGFLARLLWCGFTVGMSIFDECLEVRRR